MGKLGYGVATSKIYYKVWTGKLGNAESLNSWRSK